MAVRPRTKGNHRVMARDRHGKPKFLPSRAAQAAATELTLLLKPYAPRRPLTGPVRLDVDFILPVPGSFTKAEREDAHAGRLLPIEEHNGDRGNYLKLLEDALQAARFVVNDAQVCAGDVRKRYATADEPRPGYWFRLQPIEIARSA